MHCAIIQCTYYISTCVQYVHYTHVHVGTVCIHLHVRMCLQFVKPILDSPKSVSFICPSEVIKRLQQEITHILNQPKTKTNFQYGHK